jgi:hypothetical protein
MRRCRRPLLHRQWSPRRRPRPSAKNRDKRRFSSGQGACAFQRLRLDVGAVLERYQASNPRCSSFATIRGSTDSDDGADGQRERRDETTSKYVIAPSPMRPSCLSALICVMPTTTVQKMIGAIVMRIS